MNVEESRAANIRVGAVVRAAAETMAEPGWMRAVTTLTKSRVVLDLVTADSSTLDSSSALYARPDDDRPGAITLPLVYLTPEDFRALGEREQITITIEAGNTLPGHRAVRVDGGDAHCPPEPGAR